MIPHLNRLDDGETVQMRGHNIWFRLEIKKNYKYSYLELCKYYKLMHVSFTNMQPLLHTNVKTEILAKSCTCIE